MGPIKMSGPEMQLKWFSQCSSKLTHAQPCSVKLSLCVFVLCQMW